MRPDQLGVVYCTLPVSDALPFNVNVQVGVLAPALLHTPDQIALRPLVTSASSCAIC